MQSPFNFIFKQNTASIWEDTDTKYNSPVKKDHSAQKMLFQA